MSFRIFARSPLQHYNLHIIEASPASQPMLGMFATSRMSCAVCNLDPPRHHKVRPRAATGDRVAGHKLAELQSARPRAPARGNLRHRVRRGPLLSRRSYSRNRARILSASRYSACCLRFTQHARPPARRDIHNGQVIHFYATYGDDKTPRPRSPHPAIFRQDGMEPPGRRKG